MITGDHQATAKAIAMQVNIITEKRKSADELAAERVKKQNLDSVASYDLELIDV